jgi:hypothetical protein
MSANECKIHHMPPENKSSPFGDGREPNNLGNISVQMLMIRDNQKAAEFAAKLRESYGNVQADIMIFKICSSCCTTGLEMVEMLTSFAQRNCRKDFFVIEAAPITNSDSVEIFERVRRVFIKDDDFLKVPILIFLDSEEPSIKLPIKSRSFLVTNGPERTLTQDERACLVNDKPLLE